MPFHHEWAWYNIYYPNPDAAICRLGTEEAEWNRLTRWRDFDWYKCGGNESRKILMNDRRSVAPACHATASEPHKLPPAGIASESHACQHPGFHFELFYRLLHEREQLVNRGLLPSDIPVPFPKGSLPYGPRASSNNDKCHIRGHRC